jgi:SAM-dependent methyltransferase
VAYFSGSTEAAAAYDAWFGSAWGRYAFAVESRAILAAAGDLAGKRVLDVGCGTGRLTAALQSAGARVVGLDRDRAMLALATTHAPALVVEADAHALPFPDEAFDVTTAVTLCEFAGDPPGVFRELARVTRRGGRFVVGALNPSSAWGFADRGRFQREPWCNVDFLSRAYLLELGRPYGRASLSSVLYAPPGMPGLATLGPLVDAVGRVLPRLGAFQVISVERA